ncbi:DeoR family transcriptional regulator [Patescibacteria group bacterium]|nr:DeoR family transcriptional regulator [Patescibacteria group bacterium]
MTDEIKDPSKHIQRSRTDKDMSILYPTAFANEHHAYVSRKAERLSTAIHVVTGFIGKDEPIRKFLREISITLMSAATDRTRLAELGPESFSSRCAEVGHLLNTAEASGLVSAMNARLIADEYAKLATFVSDRYEFIRLQTADIKDTFTIRHSQDSKKTPVANSVAIEDGLYIKDTSTVSGRKADLLSLFNTRDKISIKDAVQSVRGVSEKTIQRDLLALVADGVLVKEGERRWSVYRKA